MIKKNSSFEKTKLTQIVAFDSKFFLDFENIESESCKKELTKKLKETKHFNESNPKFKPFNKYIYDLEYAEKNKEKTITIKFTIDDIFEIATESKEVLESKMDDFDSSKIIFEKYCNNQIQVIVSIDSCGIHSVRFDFELKSIETPELIEVLDFTCYFIIDYFFFCLKVDLEDNEILEKECLDCLSKPMLYSVISSTGATINPYTRDRDILGISWKFRDYKIINDNLLTKILENDVAIREGHILTVTPIVVLMVFPDFLSESYDYVEERINAIEIFWRQKFLLKKMHFNLNDLITKYKTNKREKGLKDTISELQNMQITIQSELEVYRNIIISVTHSFSMLFETLNKVFKTKNQYDFVQENLETIKSIYESLNEERRNDLLEKIQWIVILIGVTSIILQLLIVVYGPTFGPDQTKIIVFATIIIGVVGFLFIFKRQWLYDQINR